MTESNLNILPKQEQQIDNNRFDINIVNERYNKISQSIKQIVEKKGLIDYMLYVIIYENIKDLSVKERKEIYNLLNKEFGIGYRDIRRGYQVLRILYHYRLEQKYNGKFLNNIFKAVNYLLHFANENVVKDIVKDFFDTLNDNNKFKQEVINDWTYDKFITYFKEHYKELLKVGKTTKSHLETFTNCALCNTTLSFEELDKNWKRISICCNCEQLVFDNKGIQDIKKEVVKINARNSINKWKILYFYTKKILVNVLRNLRIVREIEDEKRRRLILEELAIIQAEYRDKRIKELKKYRAFAREVLKIIAHMGNDNSQIVDKIKKLRDKYKL